MERPKDRSFRLDPFTCPECGETKMLPHVGNRKVCPECREKLRKQRYAQWQRDSRARKAENKPQEKKPPKKVASPAPPKKKPTAPAVDERTALQIKLQCKKCDWYRCGDSGVNPCCIYYLRHGVGHRVDPGNGPGDCRMFLPKGARLRKTKIDDGKRQLAQTEADFMGSKPRKEDKENATR